MSIYTIAELELNVQYYEKHKQRYFSEQGMLEAYTEAWHEAREHVAYYEREIEATKRAIELLADREEACAFCDDCRDNVDWKAAFIELYIGLGLKYSPASADLDHPEEYESGGPTAAVCVGNDGFSDIDAGSNLDQALALADEEDDKREPF